MLTFVFYGAVILILGLTSKSTFFSGLFQAKHQVSWITAGLSLLMFHTTTSTFQLSYGLIDKYGLQGMWLLWAGSLGTAIVPIVFAPLWKKLNLITDNQFILVRFSGKSAKILHLFRAVYVGGFVVAFGLSFQILAFARLIEIFYGWSSLQGLLISGGLVSLFALKNSFQLKLRYDVFHSVLYFFALGVLYFFIQSETNGFANGIESLKNQSESVLNLLPSWDEPKLIYSLAIFIGVQWWSAQLFDGGGVEMARYTATRSPRKAIAAGLFRDALGLGTGLVTIIIVILAFAVSLSEGEIGFVKTIFNVVPEPYTDFIFLGFFALFITSAEATINWGSSFLTEDVYRGYMNPKVSQKKYRLVGVISMVGLSVAATIIAHYGEQLEILIKILFSISAGVCPVYILRWFWLRINAWSQLSAMISSGLYTLLFLYMESQLDPWWNTEVFDAYEIRLLAVTALTSATWVIVTFLTPADSQETLAKFRSVLPTGRTVILQFAIALAIGVLITGLFAFQYLHDYQLTIMEYGCQPYLKADQNQ